MGKIIFIIPSDSEYGFSLAGFTTYNATEEDIEDVIKRVLALEDSSLVIVEETLLKGIPEDNLREIEKRWHGILLALPSPERPEAESEDYVSRLIRKAIGYHVRLRV